MTLNIDADACFRQEAQRQSLNDEQAGERAGNTASLAIGLMEQRAHDAAPSSSPDDEDGRARR